MDASRALIFICLFFLLGLSLGAFNIAPLFFIILILAAAGAKTAKLHKLAVGLAIALSLGFLLGTAQFDKISYLRSLNEKEIETKVIILEDLTSSATHRYLAGGSRYRYEIITDKELETGQVVTLKGKLQGDEEPWDRYGYTKGEIGTLIFPRITVTNERIDTSTFFSKLNNSIGETYISNLSPDAAGLAAGLFLGEKSELSAPLKRALITTGTIHIVVLSGYNITIVIALMSKIFAFLRLRLRMMLALLGILAFLFLVGFSPSVVRAAIMGSVLVIEPLLGRKRNQLAVLIATATIMSLVNPLALTSDPGFQLSFLATLGLILFEERVRKLFKRVPGVLRDSLSTSLAAQILVLPALAYYFGSFSPLSPLINMLVLPFIPISMLVSAVLTLAPLIPELAVILSSAAEAVLLVPLKLIEFGSGFSVTSGINLTNATALSAAAMFLLSRMRLKADEA